VSPETLSKYLAVFGNLNRKVSKEHGRAPHKPILLLAVLDEIQRGAYPDGLITITPELVATFQHYWRSLVASDYWRERMEFPFRYLYQDGFWHFRKNGVGIAPDLDRTYSLLQLSREFDGAFLSPDLWQLLQEPDGLNALWAHLLQTCFDLRPAGIPKPDPQVLLDYEAEKLKAEAQSKFRVKKIREASGDEGYYLRHALFPRVVKSLYGDACAVCNLAVRSEHGGGIVDAAHIMPFAEFHNDDPRNGLALCKNHHRGFDAGWFSVTDRYQLIVSPRLANHSGYVTEGAALRLPTNPVHHPALRHYPGTATTGI
jgi:putative restriction endonuclease